MTSLIGSEFDSSRRILKNGTPKVRGQSSWHDSKSHMAFKAFTTTKVRKQLSAARKRNEGTTAEKKTAAKKKFHSFIQNSFLATILKNVPIYRKMEKNEDNFSFFLNFKEMTEKSLGTIFAILAISSAKIQIFES